MRLVYFLAIGVLNAALCLSFQSDELRPLAQTPIVIDLNTLGELEEPLKFTVDQLLESPELYSDITGYLDLRSRRLVQLFNESSNSPRWIAEGDKYRFRLQGVKFMDITDHPYLGALNHRLQKLKRPVHLRRCDPSMSSPTPASNIGLIHRAFDSLNATHLKSDIRKLTSFWSREYHSRWGAASSNWIYESVNKILSTLPRDYSVTTGLSRFEHSFIQSSIIARLESTAPWPNKRTIILSAHQDSMNYRYPFYRAPGADDDGSGTVSILQVLRSLVNERFVPPYDVAIEWHWYAAEEGGLLGSQDVAAAYEKRGASVKGVFQMDGTAYVKPGTTPIIAFFDHETSPDLTSFTIDLVSTYLTPSSGIGWNYTGCDARCGSDHMSWHRAGYEAIFAMDTTFENAALEHVHTTRDSLEDYGDAYSFEHMLEFVRLGIAWIVELSTA